MRSPTLLSVSYYRRFCRVRLRSFPPPDRNVALWPSSQRALALVMALLLLPTWQEALWAQQSTTPQFGQPQQNYSGQLQSDDAGYPAEPYQARDSDSPQANGQVLSQEQLQQLVAPIALYPDRLIALMVTASAYPAQIVDADNWLQARRTKSTTR